VARLLLIAKAQDSAREALALPSPDGDVAVTWRQRPSDVRGAIRAGAFDVCLIQAGRGSDPRDNIAELRDLDAAMPVVVLLEAPADPAEQARLVAAGADSVLTAPLAPAVLAALIQRLARKASTSVAGGEIRATAPAAQPRAAGLSSALEVLRDFSQVLGDSLDQRRLASHFLLKLREIVGVARVAIFLESGEELGPLHPCAPRSAQLTCAAAIGLSADLAECFSLTRQSGLGLALSRRPEILRASSASAPGSPGFDSKIARELEVLDGEVAVPIHDRERTIGVAVLGGRILGGEIQEAELLLVFHLLEQLGLAVKNSRLHRQIVEGHRLVGQVLDGLTVGAAAIGPDQTVVYANRAILGYLAREGAGRLSIHDLPPPIAARVHEFVERGAEVEPFFHELASPSARCFRVSLVALNRPESSSGRTALLLLEDFTPIRAAQRAEVEASNLQLISLMARRFAHEVRNSLVPLTTHAQLFDSEIADPAFRNSLKGALHGETRRILRFTDQMLLLARPDAGDREPLAIQDLLRSSFEKSKGGLGAEGEIEIEGPGFPVRVHGHLASLGHAFSEIFLNGLQAGPEERRVVVSLAADTASGVAEIRVRDGGEGFTPEVAARATDAFFTTRNTGVGLGLTIARRVIEAHSGTLHVHPRRGPSDHDLTIRLPLSR